MRIVLLGINNERYAVKLKQEHLILHMNLYQFNGLPIDGRAQAVWSAGTFLAVKSDGLVSTVLYHMSEFFAEVWYEVESNKVVLVRGFKSNRLLEPYAEMIDVSSALP